MQIIITKPDGETESIAVSKQTDDCKRVIETHGYDIDNIEYRIKKSSQERVAELEQKIRELE